MKRFENGFFNKENLLPILEQPDQYTYSKKIHMDSFLACKHPDFCRDRKGFQLRHLKWYQDLITHIFIEQYIPSGSRILEIGGGNSRILEFYRTQHECWNLDKFEGVGNGPKWTEEYSKDIHVVLDYIGNFNLNLPENYFDFVFSISVLEHLDYKNPHMVSSVIKDINRVLKKDGYSFHTFDAAPRPPKNEQLKSFFDNQKMINNFTPVVVASQDPDLHHLTEEVYEAIWKKAGGFKDLTYGQVGPYFSYNFFWQK